MKISKICEIKNFCEWYLENVNSPASSREITDYSLIHKKVKGSIRMSVQKVAGSMRGHKEFKFEDGKWSLTG